MRSPSPARLVLRRLSLSMKISGQRRAGRRKSASASLVSPSHGPLRFVTSHWCFAFASMWNTRHLRRKKISAHHLVLDRRDKNQYVVAEFHSWFKFFFLLLQNHTIPSVTKCCVIQSVLSTYNSSLHCWFSHDDTKIQTTNYRSYRDFTLTMY